LVESVHDQMHSTEVMTALSDGLDVLALVITPEQRELLLRHAAFVLQENAIHNLTRIVEPLEVIRLHVLDSVTVVPLVRDHAPATVLDIGSGAGYPGLPIAILTAAHVDVADSRMKKARFLESAVSALGLQVGVYSQRAEELVALDLRYDLVVARAVSSLAALAELAAPLLTAGGHLAAMKAQPSTDELRQGDAAAVLCGLKRCDITELVLPGGEERRQIITYERVSRPRVRLPRNPGMAQRHPLGC